MKIIHCFLCAVLCWGSSLSLYADDDADLDALLAEAEADVDSDADPIPEPDDADVDSDADPTPEPDDADVDPEADPNPLKEEVVKINGLLDSLKVGGDSDSKGADLTPTKKPKSKKQPKQKKQPKSKKQPKQKKQPKSKKQPKLKKQAKSGKKPVPSKQSMISEAKNIASKNSGVQAKIKKGNSIISGLKKRASDAIPS